MQNIEKLTSSFRSCNWRVAQSFPNKGQMYSLVLPDSMRLYGWNVSVEEVSSNTPHIEYYKVKTLYIVTTVCKLHWRIDNFITYLTCFSWIICISCWTNGSTYWVGSFSIVTWMILESLMSKTLFNNLKRYHWIGTKNQWLVLINNWRSGKFRNVRSLLTSYPCCARLESGDAPCFADKILIPLWLAEWN